jgi:hypothetical protein
MKLKEEISDFVYLGKRIDKALKYVKTNKPDLIKWFKEYVETLYQDIMSGGLELEEEDYIFDYLDSLLDDLEKQFNIILEKQTKMNKETLRMQMLSGIITEGEYKQKLEENKTSKTNESLNENFVGMGMVGNIFDREKTDYEIAFEHFSKGKMNEEMDSNMEKTELLNRIKNLDDFGFTGDKIEFNGLLITASTQEDEDETPYYFVYGEDDESEEGIFNSTIPEEVAEFVLNY